MRKIWIWATCGFLVLCFVAVFLFGTGDAMPTITPKIPTPSPTPIVLEPDPPNWWETQFFDPIIYENLDIFPNIKTDKYPNTTCVVYSSGDVCYIPEVCSEYEKSQDGQKAVALGASGKLWFINFNGARVLAQNVSDFSLAGDGSYLYFISNNNLYGYDPKTANTKRLYVPTTEIAFVVSSPAGGYCAFSESTNQIRILERRSGKSSTIALGTRIASVATISEDGQWLYAYYPEIGFLRVNTTNKALTLLSPGGDMISKLYFNKDATELYYEYEQNLYFCSNEKNSKKVLDMDSSWWQLMLENPNDVYTREYHYVGDMFFYNGAFSTRTLLYGMYNLYRATPLTLDIENILWYNDVSAVFQNENGLLICYLHDGIPHHTVLSFYLTNNWKDILDYASGILLYLDTKDMVHAYDVNTMKTLFSINFSDIENYALSQDGTFYYLTGDGLLTAYSFENEEQIVLGEFPSNSDYSDVYLIEKDGGVYLYDNRGSTRKIYRVSMKEPYVIYLGEEA